jgi:serine/threonine-protein phosphatase PGAM5
MNRLVFATIAIATLVSCALPAWAQEGEGVRTLYIVRHGFYDYEDEADPDVGKALYPIGVAQARLTAARLRGMPVEFTAIFASTMTRARQTAFVMAADFPGLEVQQTRILRECTPTTWREDIMAEVTAEEAAECEAQLDDAFSQFFTPSPDRDRHEILVCHGNVTRYLVMRALGVDRHAWLGMSVGNCGITTIRIAADGAIKVLGVGDVGHIPPNLRTGLFSDAEALVAPLE